MKQITLPNFALPALLGRVRCPKCDMQISQRHVTFAGIGRDKQGLFCFTYEFECQVCRKPSVVVHDTHKFTRSDWWNEIAEWHAATPPVPSIEQLVRDSQLARRTMPKIGPMILDMAELESVWVRGGYMGEVGPVHFIYEGTEPNSIHGVLQLEPDHHVSLFNYGDPWCLAKLELGMFAALPDYGRFTVDRREWIKMPVSDITDIITDNVFGVLTDDLLVTAPKPASRRKHGSTHTSKGRRGNRRPPRDPRSLDS